MCLSTVYQNTKDDACILMKNVMHIACTQDSVILTDLMGREITVPGALQQANLVDGYVIIAAS